MLQSIDTLIAFVVIMTVASLFVTILVQMVSAALSLRGKNLANALALTFQTIAPSLQGDAHALSARILSDPLLSDSTRTPKKKLESLVTTVAQRCAPWHFRNIKDATRLANAVRPEEVYAALKRLAEDQNDPEAKKLLAALFVSQEEAETIRTHLGAFRAIADEIADAPNRAKTSRRSRRNTGSTSGPGRRGPGEVRYLVHHRAGSRATMVPVSHPRPNDWCEFPHRIRFSTGCGRNFSSRQHQPRRAQRSRHGATNGGETCRRIAAAD